MSLLCKSCSIFCKNMYIDVPLISNKEIKQKNLLTGYYSIK